MFENWRNSYKGWIRKYLVVTIFMIFPQECQLRLKNKQKWNFSVFSLCKVRKTFFKKQPSIFETKTLNIGQGKTNRHLNWIFADYLNFAEVEEIVGWVFHSDWLCEMDGNNYFIFWSFLLRSFHWLYITQVFYVLQASKDGPLSTALLERLSSGGLPRTKY